MSRTKPKGMTQAATGNGGSGYSIRVVSRLTGISADTLRMWERRYGFPKPERNAAGVRVYTQGHVERLMLVARALKSGYRAGEVIHQSSAELGDVLAGAVTAPPPATDAGAVQPIVDALHADDIDTMRAELRRAVATLGPKGFVTDIAAVLLERVGEEWATRRLDIRHEHLLSDVLSSQMKNLRSAYEGTTRDPIVLLATLPGEHHSLGLEMVALYLAVSGATPRILGADTPPDQLVEAARALGAHAIGLSVSAASDLDATLSQLGWIMAELPPDAEVWLGGKRAKSLVVQHPRIRKTIEWTDLDAALTRWAAD